MINVIKVSTNMLSQISSSAGLAREDTAQDDGEDFLAAERSQGSLEIVEIKSPGENSDDVNLLEEREDMEDERKVLKHGCESPKMPSLSIRKVRTGEDITHKVKKRGKKRSAPLARASQVERGHNLNQR